MFSIKLNTDEALQAVVSCVEDDVTSGQVAASNDFLAKIVNRFTSGVVYRLSVTEDGRNALAAEGFTKTSDTEFDVDNLSSEDIERVVQGYLDDEGFGGLVGNFGLEDETVDFALDNQSDDVIERLRSNGDIPDIDEAASALADASDAIRNAESALGV